MNTGNDSEKKLELREMQLAALKHDLSTARPLKEIVLGEIRNGVRPEWIVVKYGHFGVTLERVLAAKAAIEGQAEERREREKSARGDSDSLDGGEVDHAA